MTKLVTLECVSRLCNVSSRTVLFWIQKGYLHGWKNAQGEYQFKQQDVVRALQNMRLCIPDELITGETGKVLIIDDEAGIRKFLRLNLLDRFPGIAVEESAEGFHAGWRAHDFIPDVLLLDILMPGLDGFRLCHLLKQYKELSATKIIAMSALGEHSTKTKIMALGADDFLAKPFTMDLLEEKMMKLHPEKFRKAAA